MTDLDILASAFSRANGAPVTVSRQINGNVRAVSDEREWIGPESEWTAAILAACSAKFIRGILVLPAPDDATSEEISATLRSVRPVLAVILRPGWAALSREELIATVDQADRSHKEDQARARDFYRSIFGSRAS